MTRVATCTYNMKRKSVFIFYELWVITVSVFNNCVKYFFVSIIFFFNCLCTFMSKNGQYIRLLLDFLWLADDNRATRATERRRVFFARGFPSHVHI